MTTYSFTVELSEQEMWSVEEALKFYITAEAAELRESRPDLTRYYGIDHIHRILASRKLYGQPQLTSTSSFIQRKPQTVSLPVGEFPTDLLANYTRLEKVSLIIDIATLMLKNPMQEFQDGSFLQLIHSPKFQGQVLDKLIELHDKYSNLVSEILKEPANATWIHEVVAKTIRASLSND